MQRFFSQTVQPYPFLFFHICSIHSVIISTNVHFCQRLFEAHFLIKCWKITVLCNPLLLRCHNSVGCGFAFIRRVIHSMKACPPCCCSEKHIICFIILSSQAQSVLKFSSSFLMLVESKQKDSCLV